VASRVGAECRGQHRAPSTLVSIAVSSSLFERSSSYRLPPPARHIRDLVNRTRSEASAAHAIANHYDPWVIRGPHRRKSARKNKQELPVLVPNVDDCVTLGSSQAPDQVKRMGVVRSEPAEPSSDPRTGSAGAGIPRSALAKLFIFSVIVLIAAVSVETGFVVRWFPWLVEVTSLSAMPSMATVSSVAIGVAICAAAVGVFGTPSRLSSATRGSGETHESSDPTYSFRLPARTLRNRRLTLPVAPIIVVVAVAAAVSPIAEKAREQPALINAAVTTQRRGDTGAALAALAPAVDGHFDPARFMDYYLVSEWAGSAGDWALEERAGSRTMQAAVLRRDPISLVVGRIQYEMATGGVLSSSEKSMLIGLSGPGQWQGVVALLLEPSLQVHTQAWTTFLNKLAALLPQPEEQNAVIASGQLRVELNTPISQ
jgi:hypothetical protein